MNRMQCKIGLICSGAWISLAVAEPTSVRFLQFESALPGKILKAEKVLNPRSGRVEIKLFEDGVETALDLAGLERQEAKARRAENGNLGQGLAEKIASLKTGQPLNVAVHLKSPPVFYLDKTKHPTEALRANSLAAAAMAPFISLDALAARVSLPKMEARGQEIGIAALSHSQIQALKFDPDVAVIEEVRKSSPLAPEFSTLSASAYNPPPVPAGSGAGVRAATFEMGLNSAFLNCMGVTPVVYESAVFDGFILRHSLASFRCLAFTAPGSSLYHHKGDHYDQANDINFLINNQIQTVSISMARGKSTPYRSTYAEFLVMDDFAYRFPYPVFVNPTANEGYEYEVNWQGYNGVSVGNVRHTNNSTYEMVSQTQARNPPPAYGGCISGSGPNCAGDREMPHILVPGAPYTGTTFATTCLGGSGTLSPGTSWSAPTGNGIAAAVIAADSRMVSWPEKVRAALILTAQNEDGGYWSAYIDGRDGAGVVSGFEAVAFAVNHTSVSENGDAAEKGMMAGSLYGADFSAANKRFNYLVPNPKPAGKHLRVVLTWDSNPVVGGGVNALSDLDLTVQINGGSQGSYSWDNNIEVVEVSESSLTAGGSYYIDVDPIINRIPAGARANYLYYAIAWTWVKDHAP